jgi:hypothetical protein
MVFLHWKSIYQRALSVDVMSMGHLLGFACGQSESPWGKPEISGNAERSSPKSVRALEADYFANFPMLELGGAGQ